MAVGAAIVGGIVALLGAAIVGSRRPPRPSTAPRSVSISSRPAVAASSPAEPPDSLAPPGAQHNWLPKEGWVWMHWLPFDETELASALGTDAAGIRSYVSDDRHLLANLAIRRGWRVRALAAYLTRHFDGLVSVRRLSALRWRTERILTQGHLAQHVLYHTFHGPAIPAHAEQLFGVSPGRFVAARQAGLTPDELATRENRRPAAVRTGVLRILVAEADEGVRTLSETRSQSDRMLARQRDDLACWMASPLPKLDPSNPYGGRNGDPGGAPGDRPAPVIPGCDGMDMKS